MAEIWSKLQKGIFIIAEAGKNFIQTEEDRPVEEYLKNAMQLVDEAASAGADAIKFQTHNVEDEQLNINVVSPHFKGSDRYRWVSRNEKATPVDRFWKPLKAHCDKRGIVFFSTPMSRGAAMILDKQVGTNLWKIGSGDILDFVMLDYIRQSGKPIIISSGMSTLEEVETAVKFLREKNERVALLHCVSKYPCPPEELNLKTIDLYKEKFDIPIGFSDHSLSDEHPLMAVWRGATILEKHFSISRDFWGSDHKVSMTPPELKKMIVAVRACENNSEPKATIIDGVVGLGKKDKFLQEGETVFRPLFRKSLMAGQDIPPGTVLKPEMIYAMRPQQYAGGLPSEHYEKVLGKKTKAALKKYDPITEIVLEGVLFSGRSL